MTAPQSTASSSTPSEFRFRPRFRGLAIAAVVLGALLSGIGALTLAGSTALYAAIGGLVGVALGGLYLLSPAWRLVVVVDEGSLSVRARSLVGGETRRFQLPWGEIERVVASADTHTCFVDGGDPSRSLLIPGHGANASYDIADKVALYRLIIARVPEPRIEWVPLIESAVASAPSSQSPGTAAQ